MDREVQLFAEEFARAFVGLNRADQATFLEAKRRQHHQQSGVRAVCLWLLAQLASASTTQIARLELPAIHAIGAAACRLLAREVEGITFRAHLMHETQAPADLTSFLVKQRDTPVSSPEITQ